MDHFAREQLAGKDLRAVDTHPRRAAVSSYTEWDPLEEVIVGIVDDAVLPTWHDSLRATMPEESWPLFKEHGGKPFDAELKRRAREELEIFVKILEAEGVRVRRPEPATHDRSFATPGWSSAGGLYSAMPRDVLLVIGNELIEAPMAWRCRYFEIAGYRKLLKHYFQRGARWTAAPKPLLMDAAFDDKYEIPDDDGPYRYVIGEEEPTFDAADFIRFGSDIIGQLSNVTNHMAFSWLQAHLGDKYRVHRIDVRDACPMHIDATLLPLAPGKVLVNPERLPTLPSILRHWEPIWAPKPTFPDSLPLYMSSSWISMNLLSLDEERVIVEENELPMIETLKRHGFKPIPCPFRNFNAFGGSFHCATLDVRRRGTLQSYL
jgi:glycine amidinotransferase